MSNDPFEGFEGFDYPRENWSKLPHVFIEYFLPRIDTLAELKLLLYLLRHTWGFDEYGIPKHITTDEFQFGRKRRDGSRYDSGTGLGNETVRRGLKAALAHNLIQVVIDDTDKGRIEKHYTLRMKQTPQDEGSARRRRGVQPPAPQTATPAARERSEKETLERNREKETLERSKFEKRVGAVLAKLTRAKIKFGNTDYPDRRVLIKGIIEEYGYKTVMMAIQEAERENAQWWSYVAIKLEAQRQVVLTGEDYISGALADYIDH